MYIKNIAVIKGIKDGFSADGGNLSGLVKVEKYSKSLKIEVSLINFAPLSEGRYVCAVSDGEHVLVVENCAFEGESEVDATDGFASLICYINGGVFPIASAVCGNFHERTLGIKEQVERLENNKQPPLYEDEAIAEENYYEYQADEGDCAVRADKAKEEKGSEFNKNEEAFGAVKTQLPPEYAQFSDFYGRMKDEIENVFSSYPPEENLCKLIEGSKWAKISYGDGKFYVFGVIFSDGKAEYIAYGVPSDNAKTPPESMKNLAFFVPESESVTDRGFWIMYQDARTGVSVKAELF